MFSKKKSKKKEGKLTENTIIPLSRNQAKKSIFSRCLSLRLVLAPSSGPNPAHKNGDHAEPRSQALVHHAPMAEILSFYNLIRFFGYLFRRRLRASRVQLQLTYYKIQLVFSEARPDAGAGLRVPGFQR